MKKGWIFFIIIMIIGLGLIIISLNNLKDAGFTLEEGRKGRFIIKEDYLVGEDQDRREIITDIYENTTEDVVVKNFTDIGYSFRASKGKYIEDDVIGAIERAIGDKIILNIYIKGHDIEVACRPNYKCWIEFIPETRKIKGNYEKINPLTKKLKVKPIELELPVLQEGKMIKGRYIIEQEKIKEI